MEGFRSLKTPAGFAVVALLVVVLRPSEGAGESRRICTDRGIVRAVIGACVRRSLSDETSANDVETTKSEELPPTTTTTTEATTSKQKRKFYNRLC